MNYRYHVFLNCEKKSDVANWINLNLSWFEYEHDKITVFHTTADNWVMLNIQNIADYIHKSKDLILVERSLSELCTDIDISSICETILFVNAKSVVRDDWKRFIDQAQVYFNMTAATGRWVIASKGKLRNEDLDGVDYADMMPSKIVHFIDDWNFSSKMQCIKLRSIPGDFCWLDGDRLSELTKSIMMTNNPQSGLNLLLDILNLNENTIYLYLPDIVVYDTSAIQI